MSFSVIPVDAIHAASQALGQAPGATGPASHAVEVADIASQGVSQGADRPSAQDAAAFARAALAQDSSPAGVQAAAPPLTESLGSRLAHQADGLSRQIGGLQGLLTPDAASGTEAAGPAATPNGDGTGPAQATLDKDEMNGAVAKMEHAYLFAIETMMASRGSTETTKIFNTLLKGQ